MSNAHNQNQMADLGGAGTWRVEGVTPEVVWHDGHVGKGSKPPSIVCIALVNIPRHIVHNCVIRVACGLSTSQQIYPAGKMNRNLNKAGWLFAVTA